MAEVDTRSELTRLDAARDRAIAGMAARTVQRTDDALRFLATVLALLTLAMLGVWLLLTYLEPCEAGSLCLMLATPTRSAWHLRARDALSTAVRRVQARALAAYLRHRLRSAEFDLLIYQEDAALLPQRMELTRGVIEQLRVRLLDAERAA